MEWGGGESFEQDFVEVYEESTGTKVYGAKYLVCKAGGRDSLNALIVPQPVICKVLPRKKGITSKIRRKRKKFRKTRAKNARK